MSETTRSEHLAQVSLPVQGMTCAACVAKVEKTLKTMTGVQEVHVNLLLVVSPITFPSN